MVQFNDYDIGVIVGRYQIAELHKAHLDIIQEVTARHKRTIIFIGCSKTLGTKEHPLDYPARKAMVQEAFPNVMVAPLVDMKEDYLWSQSLDTKVREIFPIGKVCLYGGRDSFLKYYSGNFEAREFPAADYRPATEIRKEIGNEIADTVDFRKGVIYSTQNQYPRTHLTVDVAILQERPEGLYLLLGKKPNEKKWRFPGGFVDKNETLESACRREVQEETGIAVEGSLNYICSLVVNDWRYAGTSDSLLTSFFYGYYTFGAVKAGDDLAEVEWFKLSNVESKNVVDDHRPLLTNLKKHMEELKDGK